MEDVESKKKSKKPEKLSDFGAEPPWTGHNLRFPITENPEEHGYAAGSDAFGETFGFNPKDSQSIASDWPKVTNLRPRILCFDAFQVNGRCGFLWCLKAWTQILEEMI